jgi:hypothetical protein
MPIIKIIKQFFHYATSRHLAHLKHYQIEIIIDRMRAQGAHYELTIILLFFEIYNARAIITRGLHIFYPIFQCGL